MKTDLAFALDGRFATPLRVALASVVANASAPERLRVWIATDQREAGADALVRQLATRSSVEVRWLPLNTSSIADAPVSLHWTRATYLRLLLASSLPPFVERFVYLDADVVVEKDLQPLYDIDLGGRPVAAVRNARQPTRTEPLDFTRYPYFNAGVLVVDRPTWAAKRVAQRALQCVATYPESLRNVDQDALNIAVAGDWKTLDARWNQQANVWEESHVSLGLSRAAARLLRTDPFIIHFSGFWKPWQYGDDHPLRSRFIHYSRLAGLPRARPAPASVVEVVTRASKALVPRRCRPTLRGLLRSAKRLFIESGRCS
jgi:lipopolysaccharide biosynthesis glycosyltransferase